MASPLDFTNSLRERLADPATRLLGPKYATRRMTIHRRDITAVERMSKYITIVRCPAPTYVSTVFNKDFSFVDSTYECVRLRRCYEDIYYDIQILK